MTNKDKQLLRHLIENGYSNKEIKEELNCCDTTISRYRRVFGGRKKDN